MSAHMGLTEARAAAREFDIKRENDEPLVQ